MIIAVDSKNYKGYNIIMEHEKNYYHSKTWIFHVQSPEDFYRQLQDFAEKQYADSEVEDTALAKEMLQAIGIKTQ